MMPDEREGLFVKAKVFGKERLIWRGSNLTVTPHASILIFPPPLDDLPNGAPYNAIEIYPDGETVTHKIR
jgi:hypothetical protein